MGLLTDPNDQSNTYGRALKDRVTGYAGQLGNLLLGKGTATDATAQTQDLYKQYVMQAMGAGEKPLDLGAWQQWMQSQQQPMVGR